MRHTWRLDEEMIGLLLALFIFGIFCMLGGMPLIFDISDRKDLVCPVNPMCNCRRVKRKFEEK